MIFILTLLISSNHKISDTGTLLIYISTWILTLHVWLGANYIIKHLKPEKHFINYILNIIALGCLISAVFFFDNFIFWCLLLTILFSAAVLQYKVINRNSHDSSVIEYTAQKIKCDVFAIPVFFSLALLAYIFKDISYFIFFLQVITLLLQLVFAIWLILIKKVYSIF